MNVPVVAMFKLFDLDSCPFPRSQEKISRGILPLVVKSVERKASSNQCLEQEDRQHPRKKLRLKLHTFPPLLPTLVSLEGSVHQGSFGGTRRGPGAVLSGEEERENGTLYVLP